MQTGSQCVTIAVEGNISAGKSTLLSSLEQLGNYEVSYGEGKFRNRSFKPPSLEVCRTKIVDIFINQSLMFNMLRFECLVYKGMS